jgi:hypothetical protein
LESLTQVMAPHMMGNLHPKKSCPVLINLSNNMAINPQYLHSNAFETVKAH